MNRRNFLSTAAAASAASLIGCSKTEASELRLYTWADYIDLTLVAAFEKKMGCKVLIDTFDSNEAMFAKLSAGATGYDLLTPSSYMIKAMVRKDLLQPIQAAKVPNLSHVDPLYLARALDPKMEFSVPYMMACTCLAWLKSKAPVGTVATYELYLNEALKGRSTLLDDMREVLGAALLTLGFSLNSADPAQLAQARDLVRRWKANIAKFDSEQYKGGIVSGEFHLVQGYPSDLLQVADENADIALGIPKEGSAFTCDDFCIMKTSAQSDLAHAFIDFFTDPHNAAQNMQNIACHAPNKTAYPLLTEDFRGNEALFPADEVFAKCEATDDLGDALSLWSKTWDEVKAS